MECKRVHDEGEGHGVKGEKRKRSEREGRWERGFKAIRRRGKHRKEG